MPKKRSLYHSKTLKVSLPTSDERQYFRRRLLTWYRRNGRTLPWRETKDPYRILVSEIMLQQTQVDRVKPKYDEWITKYPTISLLASASEKAVAKLWYPLGYNIRPLRLRNIAREAVAHHGGTLPSDEKTLRSFKGIGQYTAGAILSFAFGQRTPIVDTNVARLLFRVFIAKGNPRTHRMQQQLWKISKTLLPIRHVFDFNQALMDFGAMVCIARRPQCPVCPLNKICRTFPYNQSPHGKS